MWLLWRLYKQLLREVCSSLPEASPESMANLQAIPNPMRRRGLMVAGVGLLLVLGILFLVSRPQCKVTDSTPTHTQN